LPNCDKPTIEFAIEPKVPELLLTVLLPVWVGESCSPSIYPVNSWGENFFL